MNQVMGSANKARRRICFVRRDGIFVAALQFKFLEALLASRKVAEERDF